MTPDEQRLLRMYGKMPTKKDLLQNKLKVCVEPKAVLDVIPSFLLPPLSRHHLFHDRVMVPSCGHN